MRSPAQLVVTCRHRPACRHPLSGHWQPWRFGSAFVNHTLKSLGSVADHRQHGVCAHALVDGRSVWRGRPASRAFWPAPLPSGSTQTPHRCACRLGWSRAVCKAEGWRPLKLSSPTQPVVGVCLPHVIQGLGLTVRHCCAACLPTAGQGVVAFQDGQQQQPAAVSTAAMVLASRLARDAPGTWAQPVWLIVGPDQQQGLVVVAASLAPALSTQLLQRARTPKRAHNLQ